MARTAALWSDEFGRYAAPEGHPERARRNQAVAQALLKLGDRVERLPVAPAAPESVLAIHHPRHLAELAASETASTPVELDGDTVATAHAYRGALLAAGAAVGAVDAVFRAGYQRAFSLARPPGHHAECDRAMGFCFLNNVAIAAQHAIDRHGCRRVAIVDWDVHHGNGTQRSFEGRDDVLFISSHQAKQLLKVMLAVFRDGTGFADLSLDGRHIRAAQQIERCSGHELGELQAEGAMRAEHKTAVEIDHGTGDGAVHLCHDRLARLV